MTMAWRVEHPWVLILLLIPVVIALWRVPRAALGSRDQPCRHGIAQQPWPADLANPDCRRARMLNVALSRPQYGRQIDIQEHDGRDLMLVIDLSTSMIADDMIRDGIYVRRLETVIEATRFYSTSPCRPNWLDILFRTRFGASATDHDHQFVVTALDTMHQQQEARWQRSGARSRFVVCLDRYQSWFRHWQSVGVS